MAPLPALFDAVSRRLDPNEKDTAVTSISSMGSRLRRAFMAMTTLTLCACGPDGGDNVGGGKGGVGGTGGSGTGGGSGVGPTGGASTGGTGGSNATGGSVGQGGGGGTSETGGSAGQGGMAGSGGAAGSGASGGTAAAGGKGATGGTAGVAAGAGRGGSGGSSGSAGSAGTAGAGGSVGGKGCGNTNLPAACNTEAAGMCTLNVAGANREYFLALPANYNATTPYPLVFTFHGATHYARELLDSGRSQTDRGFFRIRENFPDAIYVAPQGLVGDPGGVTGWPNTDGRDVAFTRAMIASFESNYCVDSSKIFSTGASFGGMMSNLLGCQMPDVFRAIAPTLGSLNARNCGTHPIAAWIEHGDADMTVNISGGIGARDHFIQRNGCSTTNTQSAPMSDGITTCTIYNQCTSGNYPVVWCAVPGMGHRLATWTGTEIAKFFRQF